MATPEPSVLGTEEPHIGVLGQVCPLCDQPIPPEKLVQIQARERERAEAQANQLRADFAKQRAGDAAIAKAEREQIQEQAADALKVAKEEAGKREATARAEAKKEAEAVMGGKLAAAVEGKDTATEQLEALKIKHEEDKADSAKREAIARQQAQETAEEKFAAKLQEAEEAKRIAEERVTSVTAEQKRVADERVQKALNEQRESLETDKLEAVQKEQSKAFEDRQKLEKDLGKLQRQVKKQRADELGEAAEISLYETLRASFDRDQIRPIDKGVAGADIWHDIVYKGEKCGRIIYDSKDRGAWRNDYVDKLKEDQLAAEGDYAVLATRIFPSGARQLHHQDGVLVVHPARVIAVVTMLREHVIQTHRLHLSTEAREAKTEALYEFINSERCQQLFDHFEVLINDMLELDVAEEKQHKKNWRKRGQLIKKVQKTIQVQLQGEIEGLIQDESSS